MADQDEAMSPADMDEELLEVESTAQSCIMHALRIVSSIRIRTNIWLGCYKTLDFFIISTYFIIKDMPSGM